MSYNVNGTNILGWFYPYSSTSSNANKALTSNFRINNDDISNNYVGIGTNSNIPVSQLYTIPYNSGGQSIGTKFELNLPDLSGNIDVDYKIWDPSNNNGLLIQILKSTTVKFNYDVDCSFVIVGGGGGGGNNANSNAGGGGGAGEVITGSIIGYKADVSLNIIIGNGGLAGLSGASTTLQYITDASNITITANGGGRGGAGSNSSISVTGSSSGGTGSYNINIPAANIPTVGTATQRTLSNTSVFQSMISYNNIGSLGNYQNNASGAGGGGGGALTASPTPGNEVPGVGGDGITITYGSQPISLGGGGGGGSRETGFGGSSTSGGAGGLGGGGAGGGKSASGQTTGYAGTPNTGGGGGGGSNDASAPGGPGGSGTVFFYIIPSAVKL
jgi:hypothetical protein